MTAHPRASRRALLLGVPALLLAGRALAQRSGGAGVAGPPFAGLYATPPPLFDSRRSLPDTAYEPGGASGVYVRLVWSQVAPRFGGYDLSLLDRELSRAVAAGKTVSLSVIAGGYAPPWLASRGIRTLRFDLGRGGANRASHPDEMGVPWDPAYRAAFLDLWSAIADRVRATPGARDALRIVKLTGVNRLTEELRLPADTGVRDDVCGRNDDTAILLRAGYRPSVVVDAWTRIAEGIAGRFPDQLLALDILERNDFPPVDESGATTRDPPVKRAIIAEGERRFGRRFAVQWNGLTAAGPLSETVLDAARRGTIIGWQSNAFRGTAGAGCNAARRARPEDCDEDGFAALLRRGTDTGAAYIEVWAPDAARFPRAVAEAEAALARRVR